MAGRFAARIVDMNGIRSLAPAMQRRVPLIMRPPRNLFPKSASCRPSSSSSPPPQAGTPKKQEESWWRMFWNEFRTADQYWHKKWVGLLGGGSICFILGGFLFATGQFIFGILKSRIVDIRLDVNSVISRGYVEFLVGQHYRTNLIEQQIELEWLYDIVTRWDGMSPAQQSRILARFMWQRKASYIECGEIPNPPDLQFILGCITCYVNSMQADMHLRDEFMTAAATSLQEFQATATGVSADPNFLVIAKYAAIVSNASNQWKKDNKRLLKVEVVKEDATKKEEK